MVTDLFWTIFMSNFFQGLLRYLWNSGYLLDFQKFVLFASRFWDIWELSSSLIVFAFAFIWRTDTPLRCVYYGHASRFSLGVPPSSIQSNYVFFLVYLLFLLSANVICYLFFFVLKVVSSLISLFKLNSAFLGILQPVFLLFTIAFNSKWWLCRRIQFLYPDKIN